MVYHWTNRGNDPEREILMKWFKRRPKAVDVLFRMQTTGIDVRHSIEHKPHPRPVTGYLTFTNMEGQRWQTPPFYINGKTSMPVVMPKAWITGNPSDHEQLKFEIGLEY
jgi:hypothetical protein